MNNSIYKTKKEAEQAGAKHYFNGIPCPSNLQILTLSENCSKSNKFEI